MQGFTSRLNLKRQMMVVACGSAAIGLLAQFASAGIDPTAGNGSALRYLMMAASVVLPIALASWMGSHSGQRAEAVEDGLPARLLDEPGREGEGRHGAHVAGSRHHGHGQRPPLHRHVRRDHGVHGGEGYACQEVA